ncbi:IS110 family transposase [Bacillus wiedmannii]|uniref:IS110 family transposase n=1 Tax=Bacillus wiedmannii TaxID=1890302 RepID=UPI0029587A3A|nr:transposase [Bacillus wiedmannii]
MHNRQNYLYVGVDLHKEHHTAVIINCWQEKLGEIQFENKPSAFSKFLLEVETYVSAGVSVVFGLEDVGGYGRALAKYLVDHEQVVKEVNPIVVFWEHEDAWEKEALMESEGITAEEAEKIARENVFFVANTFTEFLSKLHD